MGMQWLSSSVRWALIGVASGGLVGVLAATAVAEEGELITGAQAAEDAGTITPSSAKNQPAQEGIARAPSPATTVEEWLAQMEAAIVEITGVRVERSETGLQVILETADGDLSAPTTETVGNALIAEIPNAVLALPEGEEFQQANPAEGIARVSVTAVGEDRIQVAITGTNAPPEATVSAEAGNLVWTVVPGIAQVDDADDPIVIGVTGEQEAGYRVPDASVGTRTETPIRYIPASIQDEITEILKQQPIEVREQVAKVSVDMWGGFPKVALEVFPNVALVFDRFHVMEPVNKELNKIRKQTKMTIQGSKFLGSALMHGTEENQATPPR